MLECVTVVVATTVPGNQMLLPPESCQKEFSPPVLLYIINPSSNHTPVHIIRGRKAGETNYQVLIISMGKDKICYPPRVVKQVNSQWQTGWDRLLSIIYIHYPYHKIYLHQLRFSNVTNFGQLNMSNNGKYHIRAEALKVSIWFSEFTFPYLCKHGQKVFLSA